MAAAGHNSGIGDAASEVLLPDAGAASEHQPLGPWNPGIKSTLPRRLYPLVTVFHASNSSMTVKEIEELSDFSGLDMHSIAPLKPERLALHEILIRVMVELTVDDGPSQRDLGANFRRIVGVLIRRYFSPQMPVLTNAYDALKLDIELLVAREISAMNRPASATPATPSYPPGAWWTSWRRVLPREAQLPQSQLPQELTLTVLHRWYQLSIEAGRPLERTVFAALHKAGSGVAGKQGSIAGRGAIVGKLAVAIACNEYGSARLGELIEPIFVAAVAAEDFRKLPLQSRPIVMNTKGASAAGKSTLRPLQRGLAERIGADWRDFALISPDIWRKQLLDYGTLGTARRYAGSLAAHEVEIVDRKLDRYVTARAQAGRRTHLLIDRFRFDSFAPEGAEDSATQLLTRFGSEVYMFFMITPPEATVERAWMRGESVGRYKAVDDLLAHNVEAYTGIASLFFRWAASPDKTVHYEFLDNSVAEGETPRTIAFGLNGCMTILDVDRICDIDRFKRINIEAKDCRGIYEGDGVSPGFGDIEFLSECIRKLPKIIIAEQSSGEAYAIFEAGAVMHWREDLCNRVVRSNAARDLLHRAASNRLPAGASPSYRHVVEPGPHTLGAWGEAARP